MGSTDAKKSKKKKSRKVGRTLAASLSVPQTPLSTLDSEEIEHMTQLMDAEDVNEVIVPAFSHSPNPFLSGHQCLLCRCERPHLPKQNGDITASEDGSDGGTGSVSQLPPWVCHECRKTVEEEEKRTEVPMSALMEPDLRLEPPVLPLLSELGGSEPVLENGTLCQCKACTERRHIEAEQEREAQGLLHCWTELRHIIHCVYHQRVLTQTSSNDAGDAAVSTADIDKAKEFVHRLCVRDPHRLFQRLDEQGQEYVLEVKKRLLHQLAAGSKTSAQQAKLFLSMLLDEYATLCSTAKTLALILAELEQLHLKQFHVTCELHSKHLFHTLIYMEDDFQNKLHMLIPQLSLGSTGNEELQDDTTSDLLHRYMKFDDEMSVVSVVWRECQQFIERHNDEQAVLTAKRKMLKEDWEFFKQQRKLLQQQQQQQQEQTMCTASSPSSSPHTVELVEAQFTHMMERILQGAKPTTNEYHCPNCNRKRCPCDECSISHMITCGIINPDLLDQIHQPGAGADSTSCMAAQVKFPNELYTTLNVRPPSMSSTCSSSGSESPIIIDPERLTLPFDDDNLDLGDEDEDSRSGHSEDESTADEDDSAMQRRRPDCAIITTTNDVGGATDTLGMRDGIEHRGADLERAASYAASLQTNNTAFSCGFTQQPQTLASCECISCIFQPEAQQVRVADESQCQCHACLQHQHQKQQQQQQQQQQQLGVVSETTLPQHFPVLPQPNNQSLHLYPHIHGANIMRPIAAAMTTLQPTQLPGQHPHTLLQPQLYELHSPLPQQQLVLKAVTSACMSTTATPTSHTHQQQLNHFGHYVDGKDVRLAVSNDKLYHACLGWENSSVNGSHLMLSSQFNLPPPSPPFSNDAPLVTHSGMPLPAEDHFASVVPTSATPLFQQCTLATASSTSSTSRLGGTQCGASVVLSAPVSGLDPRVPDAHAMKRTLLNPASQAVPIHNFTPVIGASMPGTGDMCMKHNPFMYMTNHSSLTNTPHTTTISTSQPTASTADVMKLNDDLMRSSGITGAGCCDGGHQDQMYALSHGRMQPTGGATKQMVNMSHVTRMQQQGRATAPQGRATAPQGVPAPRGAPPNHHHMHSVNVGLVDANNISNSDVSSTAGSMCLEADSCGHDDNCDSNDDSCSEQSSSTSTSNQKDGKYCDCCYCEFFGHSTPPTLPTSRNYAEMRDRLRLRLKQRNEARTEKDKDILTPASPPKNEIVDQRELDELLRFINGAEEGAAAMEAVLAHTPTDNKATAKAAKRARQKQRKADEKVMKEAEEQRQAKLEQLRVLEQERAYQQLLKKKHSRHKEQQKAAAEAATPTGNTVPNSSTSCKVAATRSEKTHHSVGAVITTNGQHRPSTPGVTTSCAPSSCRASVKKSCQLVASAESKPLRSNDCTGFPCVTSQQPVKPRRQPQQGDRTKKVANKLQLKPGGSSSGCNNNIENGSPKRTPSLKLKKSGDTSDVLAQNRWNEQTSEAALTIGRPQLCGQTKVTRQNCVAVSSAHRTVSNGPVASKSCTAANCSSRTAQNCDTGNRGRLENKTNHHVTTKEQTACLHHFMQQHHTGFINTASAAPLKTCHNSTDVPTLHAAASTISVGRKKAHKLHQTSEQGSHPSPQLPAPSVAPRSGHPTNSHVDQQQENGLCGQSSLTNHVSSMSRSSPGQATFESLAWKLDKKPLPTTQRQQQSLTANASRSKCDLDRSPRSNDQNSGSISKNKKNRRKKANEDLSSLDEIFLPKEDVENGELDEYEREIEEFKRFCLDSTPAEKREKVQVTMNMKDIFSKKKSGLLA